MTVRTPLFVAFVFVACGCASSSTREPFVSCRSDNECGAGQVCFVGQGCADPTTNVVVEITSRGSYSDVASEDVPIDVLNRTLSVVVPAEGQLSGTIARELGPLHTPIPFDREVRVQANGESLLIPGVLRQYERTFTDLQPSQGTYALNIGAGKYTVTATAIGDVSIPQSTHTLNAGGERRLDFVFPSAERTLVVSGRLLRHYVAGPPSVEQAVEAPMVVQAIDPSTARPLSQQTPVEGGSSSLPGTFRLSLDPTAAALPSITLVASPKETGAPVPRKAFLLSAPYTEPKVLELGDDGPVLAWAGKVSSGGAGAAGVRLYVEGEVQGGGTFRSLTVKSSDDGAFELEAPKGVEGRPFSLVAIPPRDSRVGILRLPIQTREGLDGRRRLVPADGSTCPDGSLEVICLPNRVRATGLLEYADGAPAIGVKVRAVPLDPLEGGVLPLETVETSSDENARFELYVDPARYRFEFTPLEDVPSRFRIETVTSALPLDGAGGKTHDLQVVRLFNGRTVVGSVTYSNKLVNPMVANARLRFFHVSPNGSGAARSTLLGESVTDQRGQFTVVLPSP